jgi:hypothetical protein
VLDSGAPGGERAGLTWRSASSDPSRSGAGIENGEVDRMTGMSSIVRIHLDRT